tara:strand:+ start:237 stop:473 length:237 start_codon:yes stop_codon:yes gene_type:complete
MEFSYTDLMGWVGFFFILLGYYFNAKKKLYCFSIWGFGNLIYFIYGYILEAMPIMAMSAFVLFMNIYGYYNWLKQEGE